METLKQKMLLFQKNINAIKKDSKNPHFKNSYASLQQILSEVKPILSDLGLYVTQPIKDAKVYTIVTDSESGDSIESFIDLPANQTPQQTGSAITYFRRYCLASLLSLEIEDDDGHEASTEPEKPWLNESSEQFTKAVEYLKGNGTIGEIEKKYKLSKKVRETLLSQAA